MIDWISGKICKWLWLSETVVGDHGFGIGDKIIVPLLTEDGPTDPPVWYTVSSIDEVTMEIEYMDFEE